MAIMTRWRMPPESWCGYSSTRLAGEGMPTSSSISIAIRRARALSTLWCSRMASMIWSPMVKTGFSEVIGSWKIMEISLPRIFLISCLALAQQVLALEEDLAADDLARRHGDQLQDGQRGDALAAAGLPDHPERVPAADAEIHAVDGLRDPFVEEEVGLEVLDVEQDVVSHGRYRSIKSEIRSYEIRNNFKKDNAQTRKVPQLAT